MNEGQLKVQIQALYELKESPAFKLIKRELENELEYLETVIFDESRYNMLQDDRGEQKYSAIDLMILKRNLLKLFIEMDERLLEQLTINNDIQGEKIY